jgi:hypothetical protein
MAWFKGSTTDSQDMMDILASLGDDEHISAASIYDGGSGYAIGDTIGLSSGTYDYAPELEVRSTSDGDTVAVAAVGHSFLPLSQTSRAWHGMASSGTDVYACHYGGDIYKQTGGTGDFVALGQATRSWVGMASLGPDVYACVYGGDIYKQTGGTGDFVALGQTARAWRAMTSSSTDVYTSVDGGDIYKQTGGTGDFVALSQTSRGWTGMASLGTDVYASVYGGDIYKQTGGTGDFVALGQATRSWVGMASLGPDVYASVSGGDIYKQTGGTGDFVALSQTSQGWQGMASLGTDVYACVNGGDIYKHTGSTGYATGDLVQVVGGTAVIPAILEVTSESGGSITGLQVNNPGVYSAQPSSPAATVAVTGTGTGLVVGLTWNSSVTGIATSVYITHAGASTVTPTDPVATSATSGAGTGLKLELTWTETAWETLMNYNPKVALSATITAGGSGYAVNDQLIVNIGAGVAPENAIFIVDSVSGGAVTAVSVHGDGYYASPPTNPAATTADPSTPGGSGCTLTITYGDYENTNYDKFKHMILHNTIEDIYCGIEGCHYKAEDADLWRLEPLTGFNTLNSKFSEQPGYDSSESFVSLHDGAFDYTVSMTNRRIFFVGNLGSGSTYNTAYMGFFDTFMTEEEYPYPQLMLGMQSYPYKYTYSSYGIGGIPNPGAKNSAHNGPGLIRQPSGTPTQLYNWTATSGVVTPTTNRPGLTPIVNQNIAPDLAEEQWFQSDSSRSYTEICDYRDTDLTSTDRIARFGNTFVMFPQYISDYAQRRFLGSLTGIYWLDNADGNLNSGDRVWVGDKAYRVYHNNKKTNKNNFFCVEEA